MKPQDMGSYEQVKTELLFTFYKGEGAATRETFRPPFQDGVGENKYRTGYTNHFSRGLVGNGYPPHMVLRIMGVILHSIRTVWIPRCASSELISYARIAAAKHSTRVFAGIPKI